MTESIDEFRGKYFFLSNFYPAPVEYQGYRFENNEAAFQAAKCPERMLDFCDLTPTEQNNSDEEYLCALIGNL